MWTFLLIKKKGKLPRKQTDLSEGMANICTALGSFKHLGSSNKFGAAKHVQEAKENSNRKKQQCKKSQLMIVLVNNNQLSNFLGFWTLRYSPHLAKSPPE